MSKHHQASRRRTYGRRQHELHERTERPVGLLGWLEGREIVETGDLFGSDRLGRADAGNCLVARGIN